MCYRPLTFKSSSMHFSCAKDPLVMSIPCGHCEECRNIMRQEWFIRSYYEWKKCRSHGGNGFFYTLTYNDDNLPNYDGVPCFSYDDVKDFVKRLKEHLLRKYKVNLSYLICCEFGSITHRPHYHADFFVDRFIMPFSFYKEVESCWQKGFIYAGRGAGVIDSPSALLYVTKYITKDVLFDKEDGLLYSYLCRDYGELYADTFEGDDTAPSWSDILKSPLQFKDTQYKEVFNMFKLDYRHRSVFHLASTFYGSYLLDCPDMIQEDKETCLVPCGKEFKPTSLPRFIKRALWYDRIANDTDGKKNRFVLNERGVNHKIETLPTRVDEMEKKFRDFFTSVRLTDYQYTQLPTISPFHFDGNNDLTFFLRHNDIDFRKLAIYVIVYHNRVPLIYEDNDTKEIYKPNYFTDYENIYSLSLRSNLDLSIPRNHCFDDPVLFRELYSKLYNFKPEFQLYYHTLLLYQALQRVIKSASYAFRSAQDETLRKLREVFNLCPQ